MRTLIKDAHCVLPSDTAHDVVRSHVLLEGGRILDVDASPRQRADWVLPAAGLHLLPGVIDAHVHCRDPGAAQKEDLHSASIAAAAGGVTTLVDMPNTRPPTTTQALLDAKLALAAQRCVVNYGFYIGATPHNLAELQGIQRALGIKIFMGSSTGDLLVAEDEALTRIFAETDLPICAHCEDEALLQQRQQAPRAVWTPQMHSDVRDTEVAVRATRKAAELARRYQKRLHVLHVSSGQEAACLTPHAGLITGEACPHHLLLDTEAYATLGNLAVVNPSLKPPTERKKLWEALCDGTLQSVASDHAPHTLDEKERPYPQTPAGMPGIENLLPLMLEQVHQGRCTLSQVVHWLSEAPARIWDLLGKGRIAPGYDADLVLVDLNCRRTVHHAQQHTRAAWTPWHGQTLHGWPTHTFVGGKLVYGDGRVLSTHRGQPVRFDHQRGGYWHASA